MLKIFLKAILLVCIVLSIYLLVNPSACSNLLAGRVVNVPRSASPHIEAVIPPNQEELLAPVGDSQLQDIPSAQEIVAAPAEQPEEQAGQPKEKIEQPEESKAEEAAAPADELLSVPQEPAPEETSPYTQEDIDYAIASRYVELEREYTKENKSLGKESSREISHIVMDDFEMTPEEWEDFITRATVSNLFEKVRRELPKEK